MTSESLSLSPGATITATSVAEAAEAHLRSLLFSGALRPGQELRDTVLAKDLGIARPTARTAVMRLVSEGLLERRPGHSARVRDFTPHDARDIYAVRRLIEFEAVRRITSQGLDTSAIRLALADFQRVGDSWEAGPDADTHFHTTVVAAAGSPRLSRMFEALASEMRLMIGLLRSHYTTLGELYAEHAHLLTALESGDTDTAVALWAEHIDDAENYLMASVPDQPDAVRDVPVSTEAGRAPADDLPASGDRS